MHSNKRSRPSALRKCAPPRAYLAPEHEREGPVAADDLTLAHDRRETL